MKKVREFAKDDNVLSKTVIISKAVNPMEIRALVLLQNEAWEYIQNLFEGTPSVGSDRKMREDKLVAHKEFVELLLVKKLTIDCNGDIFVDGTKIRDYIQKCGCDDPWADN